MTSNNANNGIGTEDLELELDKVNQANKNLLKMNKDLSQENDKSVEIKKKYERVNLLNLEL